ncbi:MAG: dienelactone hydrolase family protein [Myxococcales bacterium]|nr:dienelactone hydrolase family protein [Myxococcales bacterium]
MTSTELVPHSEGDDSFDTYVAKPEGGGDRPAVLICHAWAGRSEHEEERARRLAGLGYVGAAIDLYGVGKRGHDKASNAALMNGLVTNPALLRRRLAAAYQSVRTLDGVDPDRMGIIGFCFGGLCAILAARMGLALRGVVSFHGALKIGEPLEARVKAKILVLHGQDDPLVPVADIGTFAAEMQRIHADWQLHAYPGVVHSFTNPQANDPDFGTVYDAEADRRSWREMSDFFQEVL